MMNSSDRALPIPQVKNSKILYDRFIKIRGDLLAFPGKPDYEYYTIVPKADAVNVLAIDSEGSLIATEEYRHPAGKFLLSCPGGYIDPEESPEQAAQRELLEETGYNAKNFEVIGSIFPYPGLSSQKIVFVKAEEAALQQKPCLEPSEILTTLVISQENLMKQIAEGKPVDGILCAGLLFLQVYRSHFPHRL